jgi:hypothetical protein
VIVSLDVKIKQDCDFIHTHTGRMSRPLKRAKSTATAAAVTTPDDTDRWPLHSTVEQRKQEPKGKWRVPKYYGLTMDAVKDFFVQYVEAPAQPNVQDAGDAFLVYMDSAWQYPRPSARFLDGTLLREWHLTESVYWDAIRATNREFDEAATYHPDRPIRLTVHQGRHLYPNGVDGLPRSNAHESFSRRVKQLAPRTATVRLARSLYPEYIQRLLHSHGHDSMPLIVSTVAIDDDDTILEIVLRYDTPGWITNCIRTDVGNMTVVFSQ